MASIFTTKAWLIDVKTLEGQRTYVALDKYDVWELVKRLVYREGTQARERWVEHVMHYKDFEEIRDQPQLLAGVLRSAGILHIDISPGLHIYGSVDDSFEKDGGYVFDDMLEGTLGPPKS